MILNPVQAILLPRMVPINLVLLALDATWTTKQNA
jgi:hypothetical protein